MRHRLCWLLGHTSVFEDSGYPVCPCGAHGYYQHEDWNRPGLLYLPIHWYRITQHRACRFFRGYFHICRDCRKLDLFFGKRVGNHEDCIPF